MQRLKVDERLRWCTMPGNDCFLRMGALVRLYARVRKGKEGDVAEIQARMMIDEFATVNDEIRKKYRSRRGRA